MRLGLITDLHLRDGGAGTWHNALDFAGGDERFAAALEGFAAQDVDAVALLGDLADHGDERRALAAVATAERIARVPVLAVAGNHDAPTLGSALAQTNRKAAQTLDANVLDTPLADGTVLALALPAPACTLVLSHFPVLPLQTELERRGLKYAEDHPDRELLQTWVDAQQGPIVILAGHLHIRGAFPDGPRLQAQLGPVIEHPYDTTLAQLDGDTLSLSATELPGPSWRTETRFAPAETTWRYEGRRWVMVERPVRAPRR